MASADAASSASSPGPSPSGYEQLLSVVVQANQRLLTTTRLPTAIAEVLASLGQAIGADYSCVCQHQAASDSSAVTMVLQAEWQHPSASYESRYAWSNVTYQQEGLDRWLRILQAQEAVVGTVATLPEPEALFLQQRHRQSLLLMPVWVETQLWGYLGVMSGQADRSWQVAEQAIVQAIATSLGGAIARQQQHQALQASELRLQKLADTFPGMLFQFDLMPEVGGQLTYLSAGCRSILGLEPEAATVTILREQIHPGDRDRVKRALTQSAQTLERLELEWRMVTPTMGVKWVQVSATPEPLHGGIRWHGVLFDVSDRKRVAHEQSRLLAILETTPDVIGIADVSGHHLYLNQAGQHLLGIPTEAIEQFSMARLHPPASKALWQATILPTAQQEGIWSGESQLLKPDGQTLPVSLVVMAHKDEHQQVQFFSYIMRDIRALRQTAAELRESQQLLQIVFDTLPQRVFWKDVNSVYLGCNRIYAIDAGIPDPSAIYGKTDYDLPWAQTDADAYIRDDREVMASGEPKVNFEELQLRDNGVRSWSRTSKIPLRSESGEIIGVFGSYEDITDEKEAQAKIQRANAILQAQQNAVPDGILVINEEQEVISFNQRLMAMWNIPRSLLRAKAAAPILSHLLAQLAEPEDFQTLFTELSEPSSKQVRAELILRNHLVFAYFTAPVCSKDNAYMGRIWYFEDITERRQSEQQLQESYGLFNSVINSANALIFVKDLAGKYLLVNQLMAEVFDCNPQDFLGKDDTQLYPLEIAQNIQALDRKLLQDGVPQTFEQRVPIRDEVRAFLTSKTPYYDADNKIIGLIGISRDITELQQVREERDRFFRLSNDMICTIGFDGYLKRINPAFTRLLGYSRDELLSVPITRFIHPEERDSSAEQFEQIVAGVTQAVFENRWRCQDGTYRWFSWSLTPYPESQICYATARDITDRRQTEEALRASEQRFRDVTEAAGEYVWEIDAKGIYTFLTERVQDVKGHPVASLLGRSPFTVMPLEDIATVQSILRVASEHKESFRLQHRDITADGRVVWEEVSGLPILNTEGEIIGFRGTGLSITEQKTAEASLRLYKQAVESSSDAICITDADFEYIAHNEAFAELFDLVQEPDLIAEFVSQDTAYADPQIAQVIANAIHRGHPFAGEVMMRSYRGKNIPALLRANIMRDQAGNIVGVIRAYTDISDRKAAEAQLQMQEAFLRSIYDGTAHRIFALNVLPDGSVVYSGHNRAAEEATGWLSDHVVGVSPSVMFGEAAGAAIQALCQQCIEQKQPITQEEYLTLNGQPAWVLTTFNPLQDYAGNVHRIIGTSFDITPIKQAEAQLRQQARIADFRAEIDSLLTRGEDLRTMLQGCCEVIVTFMDAAFARIWLLLDGEAETLTLQASAGLYTHIDGGHARVPVGQFKIGLIAAAKKAHLTNDVLSDPHVGDKAWAEREGMVAFAGYPLIVDEQLTGVVALFARQPLTQEAFKALGMVADEIALGVRRKQAEVQLQRSEMRLRQQAQELQTTLEELQQAQLRLVQSEKMSSLGQLVAGVAHEINNPVNFIYGNLTHARSYTRDLLHLIELYQNHYPHPHEDIQDEAEEMDLEFVMEDLPKLLNSMKVGAERIQGIVSSLRTFSRMDEAEMKAVNLHDGLDSTLMILQNRTRANANSHEVEVVRHYGDLPLVECYAGQLNQVFMNILSNALDALEAIRTGQHPDKNVARIVITTALTADNQVSIAIQDNGEGIPPGIRDRLFDPFFTTKPIGKGTGMGLSISYQIVTGKHGGSLTCTSQEGVGTTFTVTIPLQQTGELTGADDR